MSLGRRRKSDGKKPKITKEEFQKAKQILSFLSPYKWSFFIGLVFLFLGSGVAMLLPVAAGEMLNIVTKKSDYGLSLSDMPLIFLGILVLQGLSSYFRVLLFTNVSEKGMANVRKALYEKLITLPISFFEKSRVGELSSRATADVQEIQQVISITSAEFIRQILILVIGISFFSYQNSKVGFDNVGNFSCDYHFCYIFWALYP